MKLLAGFLLLAGASPAAATDAGQFVWCGSNVILQADMGGHISIGYYWGPKPAEGNLTEIESHFRSAIVTAIYSEGGALSDIKQLKCYVAPTAAAAAQAMANDQKAAKTFGNEIRSL